MLGTGMKPVIRKKMTNTTNTVNKRRVLRRRSHGRRAKATRNDDIANYMVDDCSAVQHRVPTLDTLNKDMLVCTKADVLDMTGNIVGYSRRRSAFTHKVT